MKIYFTVKETPYCPTNYGIFECKIKEDGDGRKKEVCSLVACCRVELSSPINIS
ncbi:hypothetical protein [Acidianus sp. HS-5]|uniref:hypothetical protein n=1 Tax=Acidianus sp. HS-5 TaxID=2886040 RepID=UPI001F266FF1|nr:hypothetical protein [Acidianus sp. HS-5]